MAGFSTVVMLGGGNGQRRREGCRGGVRVGPWVAEDGNGEDSVSYFSFSYCFP